MAHVDHSTDPMTGLPVYSLYGATNRPTPAMLDSVDALVYDIQDVGVRQYTYTATLANCIGISPLSTAEFAGGPPLYGTCTMSMPAIDFSSSPQR